MLPQAVLEELVEGDFTRARRRAALRRVGARMRRDRGPHPLLSFEEAVSGLGAKEEVYLGERSVPVERIVGSFARRNDFDRSFLPLRRDLAERWKRIDRMVYGLEDLAPVVLYGVGGAYYVLDGHFRVSVLRYHGAEHVRAQVTEVRRRPDGWRVRGASPAPAGVAVAASGTA